MKKMFYLCVAVCLMLCGSACDGTKKFQNVVNVHDKIQVFDPEEVMCSKVATLSVMGDYLIIRDSGDQGKLFHLFDKHNLQYLCSTGDKGQGPGELSGAWSTMYDEARHKFYVPDPNYLKIFSFDIDSLMKDPDYLPTVKQEIKKDDGGNYPLHAIYVNDTLAYGNGIQFYEEKYRYIAMKWNMQTGQLWFNQHHQGKRTYGAYVAYSERHNLLVQSDGAYDELTFLDGDMNLIRYVKGPQWSEERDALSHFGSVDFYNDYIIVEYDGTGWAEGHYARICYVFDIQGNYVKTLNLDYNINTISVDEENDRLYITFIDEIQFGYLDLKGLLP